MSISASYVVIAVLLLRLALKKAPKWITVVLWGIVAVRLICPFSIESALSLIPSAQVVSPNIITDQTPQIHTGISVLNSTLNPIISESLSPTVGDSANPLQIWIPIFAAVWIVGTVTMLVYATISYTRVKRKIGAAVLLHDNVYQSENVASPFVLGIIKPKVYLPFNINEKDMEHVIAHESAHIRRKDHLWKPLGFLLLALHWFNPLMWLGYALLCRDIELACDEKVIGELDRDARADYSQALLTCSVNRRMIAACPLAFGEVGVKDRVKSVLNYKKPALWIIIVALALCIALVVCFLTVPKDSEKDATGKNLGITDPDRLTYEQRYLMDQHPEYFGLDASNGLDLYVCQFAPESYYFMLFEHSDSYLTVMDLLSMKSLKGADSMRLILNSYDITREDVNVIPFQHPLSSYLGSHQIIPAGGSPVDLEEKQAAYKEMILDMLFDNVQYTLPTYDSMQFDVDGDGKIEHCTLGFGRTSGIFTFTFSAAEVRVGDWENEYYNVIWSDWYKLSFVKCDDGVVRVQGIDQNDEIHLFDISIVDGNVHLTENGVPIGKVAAVYTTYTKNAELVYDSPIYSYVMHPSDVPEIEISDGVIYTITEGSKERLGTVNKINISYFNFDVFIKKYEGFDHSKSAKELRKNNKITYEVDPDASANGIEIYYVMEQNSGETLIVYGHYDNGKKQNEIRFIYRVYS